METVRLDGSTMVDSVITDIDIYEMIRDIKEIKKITFCSFVGTRQQIDFIYESNFGEVECSVVKENKKLSGYLQYQKRYYNLINNDAMFYYGKILACIEKNK